MRCRWLMGLRKYLLAAGAALLLSAGMTGQVRGDEAELRSVVEQQAKQIEELKRLLEPPPPVAEATSTEGQVAADQENGTVKQILADYLRENPGAVTTRSRFPRFRWFYP